MPNSRTEALLSFALVSVELQTSEDLYEVVLARIDAVRRRQPFDAVALRATFTEGSATLQARQSLQAISCHSVICLEVTLSLLVIDGRMLHPCLPWCSCPGTLKILASTASCRRLWANQSTQRCV